MSGAAQFKKDIDEIARAMDDHDDKGPREFFRCQCCGAVLGWDDMFNYNGVLVAKHRCGWAAELSGGCRGEPIKYHTIIAGAKP